MYLRNLNQFDGTVLGSQLRQLELQVLDLLLLLAQLCLECALALDHQASEAFNIVRQCVDVEHRRIIRAAPGVRTAAVLVLLSYVDVGCERPGSCGERAVRRGLLQSIPSNSIASCATLIATVPELACGHTNFPSLSRL